jgi:hypothetical protein
MGTIGISHSSNMISSGFPVARVTSLSRMIDDQNILFDNCRSLSFSVFWCKPMIWQSDIARASQCQVGFFFHHLASQTNSSGEGTIGLKLPSHARNWSRRGPSHQLILIQIWVKKELTLALWNRTLLAILRVSKPPFVSHFASTKVTPANMIDWSNSKLIVPPSPVPCSITCMRWLRSTIGM